MRSGADMRICFGLCGRYVVRICGYVVACMGGTRLEYGRAGDYEGGPVATTVELK